MAHAIWSWWISFWNDWGQGIEMKEEKKSVYLVYARGFLELVIIDSYIDFGPFD